MTKTIIEKEMNELKDLNNVENEEQSFVQEESSTVTTEIIENIQNYNWNKAKELWILKVMLYNGTRFLYLEA
jgi:hypothetical protein